MEAQVQTFPLAETQYPQSTPLFPVETPLSIPRNIDEVSTQAALISSAHNGNTLDDEVKTQANNINTIGMDEVRRSIADKEKAAEMQVAEMTLKRQPSVDTMDYYNSVLEKHNGGPEKHAMEQAVVDTIVPKNQLNYWNDYNRRDASQNLAARNILYEAMGDASQNSTFWDKVFSFGRDLIPFVSSRATAKGVAEALNTNAGFKDYFNTEDIVNNFRSSFLSAPPEKRKEMMQALVHGITKYSSFFGDPNGVQVADHLNTVMEGIGEDQKMQTIFDVASLPIATTAKIFVRGARMAIDLGKPARVAIQAGNPELAATLAARDAMTGSKTSGLSTEEIARQATTLNVTPLEMQMQDLNIAQPIQENLRNWSSKLRSDVGDTLMPTGTNAEQVTASYNYYQELYSSVRDKSIYKYTPNELKDGQIGAEIQWQSADGVPFSSYTAAKQFGVENNKVGFATLLEQTTKSENPAVMRSNRRLKKYITPDMPESEYLGRVIGHDEKGAYFEVGSTPSYGFNPVVKENWIFVENAKLAPPSEAIGTYKLGDIEGRNFFNFKIPMFSGSIEDVSNRGLGMSANAKIRRDLEGAYKDAITGVPKAELDNVYNILREGDAVSNAAGARGHTFSQIELSAKGLSDKGIEAYYKHRLLRDNMWLIRNNQMVSEFRAQGFMEMAFDGNASVSPMNRPAKPVLREYINSQISNGRIGKVLDTKDGAVFQITSDHVDDIYNNGGQVVKLYKPEVINGRRYTHLVVHQGDAHFKDIAMPLPYRPGEFARIYSDEYFVRMTNTVKDEFEKDMVHGSTIRTAPSIKEGRAFATAMNKAVEVAKSTMPDTAKLTQLEIILGKYMKPEKFLQEFNEGKIAADAKFDVHYDRQTHSYLADTIDESITNGRLFYSQKGEKLLSTDPTRENTLGVSESLGVELANIARFITSKDIRVDAIQKWMNTFGDGVVNRNFNSMTDFNEGILSADRIKQSLIKAGSPLSNVESDQLLKFAEDSRKYIRSSLNLRTQADLLSEARHRKSVEWLEGRLPGKTGEWFGPALRKANVPDFLRAVNFNISLGMGNMAQLLVQANGMMVAAGVHPVHGLMAAKTSIPLRFALMSDNPEVWNFYARVDSLTSLGLKNTNEFIESVKAIRKSGILSDIKSTAMFNVEDGALNLYKNEFKNAWETTSPFFFNRGEEMSRLVSWEVARREWKATHKGLEWTTDDALRDISVRQKEFNIGMQSYNTAGWQKGWAGIPSQFLQYNVKLLASILHSGMQLGKDFEKNGFRALSNFDNGNYRGFNPKQATMLLGSQIVLYGLAGNGLTAVADALWGSSDNKMSEEQKMYMAEGLAGGLIYTATKDMNGENGAKLALGSRLGSFNWYQQIYDKVTTGKTDLSDFALGVTKSNGGKVIDVVSNLANLFRYSDELTPDAVLNELGKMPEILASWNNATKAYTYMQNEGFVTSKDGTPIARINTKENLAAFLGISTEQVQDYYRTVNAKTQFYDELKTIAKTVKRLQIMEWKAQSDGNNVLAAALEKQRWAIMPRDQAHRAFVENELRQKLWKGDTESDQVRREFLDKMNQEVERFSVMDKRTP